MHFERLTSREQVLELISFHNSHSEYCVLDVETTSTNPRAAVCVDVQLSGRAGYEDAVIFGAEYAELLRDFDPKITLVAHNYKYDAHVLFRHGVDLLDRTWRDTMLLGHLCDENRDSYSLDSYVVELWGDNYKNLFWSKYRSYEEAPREEADEYATKDIFYTSKLYNYLMERLRCDGIL